MLLLALSLATHAKPKTDSLLQLLETAPEDSTRSLLLVEVGKSYIHRDIIKAEEYMHQAIEQSKAIGFPAGVALGTANLGVVWYYKGDYPKALEYYQTSVSMFEQHNDLKNMAKYLNNIGVLYKRQSEFDKAIEYYIRSLRIKEEISDEKGTAASLNNIGLVYFNQGNYTKALEYHERAKTMMEDLGYREGIANQLNNLGNVYLAIGKTNTALELYVEALGIFEAINATRRIGNSYNNLGAVNLNVGNYNKSIDYFIKAVKIFEKLEDKEGIANGWNNIGMVYYQQRNYQRSLNYYLKALELKQEIGNPVSEAKTLNNIGNVYMVLDDYDQALEYLSRSITIKREKGDLTGVAQSQVNIGKIYEKQKKYAASIEIYNTALETFKEIDYPVGIASCWINIGSVHYLTADYRRAITYLEKGLKIAKEIRNGEHQTKGMALLSNAYAGIKNYRKAFEHYQAYVLLKDSILDIETNNKINELTTKYENEKREKELQQLKHENIAKTVDLLQQESIINQEKGIRNTLISGIIVILLIAGFIFYRYKIKRKVNQQLHAANTELQQTIVSLQEARERAEKSEKIMEQFLANMSHEIRTPMNAVIGMTHLLLNTPVNSDQEKYLNTIKYASDNLLVIINDILDLSKIEAGRFMFEEIPFRMSKVTEGVLDTLKLKAREKSIDLQLDYDKNIPDLLIGDPVRLNQILLNLMNNAVKFTEKGYVKLTVSVTQLQENRVEIGFEVKDTGIGIPENKLGQIFDSFMQADTETSRKFGGTGLGLTISKQLVKLLDGELVASSKEGIGSIFSFRLKYYISEDESTQQPAAPDLDSFLEKIRQMRILVVEDNSFNQEVARETLQGKVQQITIAANGKEAIDILEKESFDLVLMDIKMPVMDGFQATQHIREKTEAPVNRIPIIAITAHASRTEREKCLSFGMNDYITKPFVPSLLLEKIAGISTGQSTIADKSTADPGKLVDIGLVEEIAGGDKDKMKKLIQLFKKQAVEEMAQIRQGIAGNDPEKIKQAAHTLKSKAGYLKIDPLTSLVIQLEEAGNEGKITEQTEALAEDAEAIIEKVNLELSQMLDKWGIS